MAFAKTGQHTIQGSQISGTLTGFRVPLILTHNDLRTVGNGGFMEDATADDFRLFSDSGRTSAITFYKLSYTPTTGRIVIVMLLSSAADGTNVYSGWGDAALTSDVSDLAAFTANCVNFAYHYDSGGSTLEAVDIINAAAGTKQGGPTTATGLNMPIAGNYDGSGDRIYYGTANTISTNRISCGVIVAADDSSRGDLLTRWKGGAGNSQFDLLKGISAGRPQFYISNGGTTNNSGTGSTTMTDGQWYCIQGRHTGTLVSVWLDSVKQSEQDSTGFTLNTTSITELRTGDNSNGDGDFDGKICLGWVDDIDRSDAWLQAQSRAWLTNSTFWGTAVGGGGGPLIGGPLLKGSLIRGGRLLGRAA